MGQERDRERAFAQDDVRFARVDDRAAERQRDAAEPERSKRRRRTGLGAFTRVGIELDPKTRAQWLAQQPPSQVPGRETLYRSSVEPTEDVDAHDPRVVAALARRGSGAPLPAALRDEMQALLQADLGGVRLHTDATADDAARAIRARAFTIGEDVFFAAGQLAPESAAGRALLAHELTHVVQAQQGRLASSTSGLRVSDPDDAMEREAEHVATRVAASPQPSMRSIWGVSSASLSAQTLMLRSPIEGAANMPLRIPPGGQAINELGIVAWDGAPALRLRSSPTTTANNATGELAFNTRVQVLQRFPGDWLLVATLDGKLGFCAQQHVWYAPAHKAPEPNARLHKVAQGERGYAINIAREHYGDTAQHWGSDLRFFVNVLGAVNHRRIPDSTDGWKTVAFDADAYIWVPSVAYARSLHGALSSGSRSYELASTLGIEGALERTGQLYSDLKEAIQRSRRYIAPAIARHVEEAVVSVLESLMWMAVGAAALLAISTAIGAAIGALAGGAGAAPGASVGFEVGVALLDWLGLGFLVAWVGTAIVRIGAAFGAFLAAVWNARGDRNAIDAAAQAFAEAIGTLAGVLVEALVMWAISIGVKQASAKLQGTALGRWIGESKLGQWLSERIDNYKAGKSKLPGPREALRRLLEARRRGERGEPKPQQALPADAWSELAKRHNLDDLVTHILREQNVDPAVAERLLAKHIDQFDIGEIALDHGADGVAAVDVMVDGGVQLRLARQVLAIARDLGVEREVAQMINSRRFESLPGLRRFLDEIGHERRIGSNGKLNELMDAYRRVMGGDRVALEGRRKMPGDPESGQADIIDHTQRQAIQMKTVTGESKDALHDNLQKAIKQLSGETGEAPPTGYQRVADIRIEGKNPMRNASRAQVIESLRSTLHQLENLEPADAAPGIVRITNAIATFIITASELR